MFRFRFSSGGRTRTSDLRVMSPTSCQLLYPAMYLYMKTSLSGTLHASDKSALYFVLRGAKIVKKMDFTNRFGTFFALHRLKR